MRYDDSYSLSYSFKKDECRKYYNLDSIIVLIRFLKRRAKTRMGAEQGKLDAVKMYYSFTLFNLLWVGNHRYGKPYRG